MPTDIEKKFNKKMMEIYHRARDEADYSAKRYFQMLNEHGGVKTAKILINANKPSNGYTKLWECGRLDITVEALVVENLYWHSLFEPEELERARQRLKEYGYEIKDAQNS